MLFTLVIDKLNSLLEYATHMGILKRLTARHAASSISMFADDVVIFCHPDAHELAVVKELLRLFANAFGLRTNFLSVRHHQSDALRASYPPLEPPSPAQLRASPSNT